ncbi:M20/M25/M40 family metallo-hydrolase [Tundrisphaera sp. TA3]|uniref:M20/M25/M40 family metallo-hydrolase n=1 Tax=Tundrisphaera sp. TA3 TaxID=3435775 RepID=UPI003EBF239C
MASRTFALRTPAALAPALLLGLAAVAARGDSPPAYVSASQARIRQDVGYLAADAQEGRAPGTRGIEAAADYIAGVFREIGLKPAPGADGFFQPFTIKGNAALDGAASLYATLPANPKSEAGKDDFSPLAIGAGGTIDKLPVVFVGYGITAKDEKNNLDYDDYAGIDVKGKVVLVIRREPQLDDEKSPFAGKTTTIYASVNHKLTNAFQHGAAAVLFVNDLAGLKDGPDRLVPIEGFGSEENSPIPFVMVKRDFADGLLSAGGLPSLKEVEKEIDGDLKPRSRPIENVTVSGSFPIVRKGITTKNVIGVLEGAGPLADETIVVGGHYDHLGTGGLTSGSLAFFSKDIHNGADDNASGTAMVLELARRLARRPDPLPRRVVFMAFSGEEKGLLGSRHYVEHPLIPLDKTVMMINFDMVGRLSDKGELTIVGTGSTPGIEEIVDALGTAAGFKVKKVKGMSDGFGGSDHESFYRKDVPILFPFTGLHADYHRPSDDADKINYAGMTRIADFGELLLLDIARRPERPQFVKAAEAPRPGHGGGSGNADPGRLSTSAYLGTVPDYAGEEKGVKLSDVRPDSPAAKGGLKGGDVIVGFGGKPIATIYDYTDNLGRSKPGDKVEIVVKRDGKDVTLTVTLGSRPGQ